jgi:hypothetical protein
MRNNLIERRTILVPILIFGADIKLNAKLTLRRSSDALMSSHQHWRLSGLPHRRLSNDAFHSRLYCWRSRAMIADSDEHTQMHQSHPTTWMEAWHLWTVIVPRRSITGRLVRGKVWRRHDGRHWVYKKFIEYAHDGDD